MLEDDYSEESDAETEIITDYAGTPSLSWKESR